MRTEFAIICNGLDCIADVEFSIEGHDDSFSHEFGTEVIKYSSIELNDIYSITCYLEDIDEKLMLDKDFYKQDVIDAIKKLDPDNYEDY